MNLLQKVAPEALSENPFKLIGKDWMLITAGKKEAFNTMTASWGGMGVLWNKNVCFVFVRPSRYTYEFVEREEFLTLSFFDENYRDVLKLCGSKSGREMDKVAACGLTPLVTDVGGIAFSEARLVLTCKKLYHQEIDPKQFLDAGLEKNYNGADYHRMYVCEVIEALKK